MNTRTLTGTIYRPSGAAWPSASLVFRLLRRFAVDDGIALPERVTATTDEDGAFSVALAVPVSGTASYEFTAPAGGSAVFYLEAGAPIELAVLLAARGVSVSPDAVAVEAGLRAAADAALQAQIDAGGGGGAVDSVNGQTGVVVLTASSVGADASGTAAGLVASEAATRAAADTTNATALTTHIADTANPHAVTAAQVGAYTTTQADTLLAAKQPLDSDLTAIAALTTTTYGRALLTAADAAGAQSLLSLGTLATQSSVTASQISDASTNGRSLLTAANYAAMKTLLSLNNVENTALSTWAGSTSLTTLGTVASGTWQGAVVAPAYGGTGTANSGNLAWPSGGGTAALLATANTFTSGPNAFRAGADASVALIARRNSSSSTANIFEVHDQTAAMIAAVTAAGRIYALGTPGSASTPAYSFHDDTNTGMYSPGADQIAWAVGGLQRLTLSSNTLSVASTLAVADGSPSGLTYALSFSSNSRTGIFRNTTDSVVGLGTSLTSGTDTVQPAVTFLHHKNGTIGNGYGGKASMQLTTSTTAGTTAGELAWLWSNATHATRAGRVVLSATDYNATREFLRGEASGSAPMIGFLGASAVGVQSVGAAATDAASTQTLANNLRTALINLGLATT